MEGFFKNKYPDLPGSKPVERAVQKVKREEGFTPHGKEERIEAYLDRLEDIANTVSKYNPDDKQGLRHLKRVILEKYVTSFDDILGKLLATTRKNNARARAIR